MMQIDISINGITKDKITIKNITKGGPSNDVLNQYSVWLNDKDIGVIAHHWRDDGSTKLVLKVLHIIEKQKKVIIKL